MARLGRGYIRPVPVRPVYPHVAPAAGGTTYTQNLTASLSYASKLGRVASLVLAAASTTLSLAATLASTIWCVRAYQAGVDIYLDPSVRVTHHKTLGIGW